jgi:hypothetical protein
VPVESISVVHQFDDGERVVGDRVEITRVVRGAARCRAIRGATTSKSFRVRVAASRAFCEADRQLRRIAKRRAALDAEEARWLVIAKRERAHVELGFGSFVEYVGRIGNCGRSAAYERVRVAEWLDASPASFEALATGVASFCAIRDISRIATPETEPLWLEAIENKTVREIETLLAGRKHGDRPDDRVEPTLVPKVVRLELVPDAHALLLEARRVIQAETGEHLDDSALIAALCERALRSATGDRPPYQIGLTVCEQCDRGGDVPGDPPHRAARSRRWP